MGSQPKLGELLIHAGVIDELQLKAALAEQAHWGRRLGVTLIKLGMVEENHLIRALAQQLGLPATSLEGRRIAPEVIALVPARVARMHSVIPLFVKRTGSSGKLFLGMEDPSKLEVLDDLSFRTGLEIQPVMMGPTELATAIDRYYGRNAGRASRENGRPTGETTIGERSLGLAAGPREPEKSGGAAGSVSRLDDGVSVDGGQAESVPTMSLDHEVSLDEIGAVLPDGIAADVARAVRETEKTRIVVKAITQLLVEKKVVSLDEIQARIAQLKTSEPNA